MIENMQIVNHVREDGIRVLAAFNVEGWGGRPCQLVADNSNRELFALGMYKARGGPRWTRMSRSVTDAAAASYDSAMSAIFGKGWRDIQDGTTRVMEWVITRAA